MNPGMVEKLAPIAEKIGKTPEEVFDLIVREQYIEPIGPLFGIVVAFGLLILIAQYIKSSESEGEGSDEGYGMAMVVVILIFVAIVNGINFVDDMTDLINPEYAAMEDMLRCESADAQIDTDSDVSGVVGE